MKIIGLTLLIAAFLLTPTFGFASGEHGMEHGKKDMEHGKKMSPEAKEMAHGHGEAEGMAHLGMSTDGKMIMLGVEEVDGVKGMAHLNDVRKQMAEHGMKQTHHIMVAFEDVASGDAIESGTVAVKIEDPDEMVSEAIKLSGMDGHFGTDITLDKKGIYHFKIGTKLTDGKKRTFHLHFENE